MVTPFYNTNADKNTDPLWQSPEEPTYDFWGELTEAEEKDALKATLDRLILTAETKGDWRFYAELAVALNHKCWDASKHGNGYISWVFQHYYEKVADMAYSNLNEEDQSRYFDFTD